MVNFDIDTLKGPIIVTVVYFIMWYYFLFFLQFKTKYRLLAKYKKAGKKFDRYFGQDEEMLAVDRVVINTQEQMVPFIMALWMCTIFVSSNIATWCGGLYVVLRFFYPILLGKKVYRKQSMRVAYVTIPCYFIIFFMFGRVIWSLVN